MPDRNVALMRRRLDRLERIEMAQEFEYAMAHAEIANHLHCFRVGLVALAVRAGCYPIEHNTERMLADPEIVGRMVGSTQAVQ